MKRSAVGKLLCTLFCALLSAGSVFAGSYSRSAAGTSTGKFLSLGSSARAAGMGEAYCAAAQDADAIRYNPAALVRVEANSAQLMHASYLVDTSLEHGAFARRMGANHALGISILQMSYGDISQTDESGYEIGKAHPSNLALTAAYAYKLENLGGLLQGGSVGLSISYIRSVIVYSARTFATSLGVLSPGYGPHETQIALLLENLGGSLKFDEVADPLPVVIKAGGITHIQSDWTATMDISAPRDNSPYFAAGTEKWFRGQSAAGVAVRAGYNTLRTRDLDGLAGLSAGLGIAFQKAVLDYAFIPFGALGTVHRLTLTFNFGQGGDYSYKPKTMPEKSRPVTYKKTKPALEPQSATEIPEVKPEPVESAIEEIDAVEPDPKTEELYQRREKAAGKYTARKDYKNAMREYKEALKLLPEDDGRRVFVYLQQGQLALKLKNAALAKDFYLAAIQTSKKLGVTGTDLVNSYLGLAYCFERIGNTAAAVKNYEKALGLTSSPQTKLRIRKSLQKLSQNNQ